MPSEIPFVDEQWQIMNNEVQALLQKGAIVYSTDEPDQFVSTIFITPKPNGKFRPVINLRYLNNFVHYEHFKQETFKVVLDIIQKGDFCTSIDLQDAYFSVPISYEFQKYLKFRFNGILYSFVCMPFGLSSAPRVFTKILRPIYAWFRFQNIRCSYYIDDSLNMNQCHDLCKVNCITMVKVLESLGFTINENKSSLVPSQRLIFFGFILDSEKFMVFLTEEKIHKIIDQAQQLLSYNKVKVRDLASFIGRVVNAFFAVLEAPMFYRSLERDKIQGLKENKDFENHVILSHDSREELDWWIVNIRHKNGKRIRPFTFHCFTDASQLGFGCYVEEDGRHASGRWTQAEANHQINYLELLAIFYALQSFFADCSQIHIEIQTDNVSCVTYIADMCSLRLDRLAKQIWQWCLCRNIYISAVHTRSWKTKY